MAEREAYYNCGSIATTHLTAIDNGVEGDPAIQCEHTRVIVRFKTEKPFSGRVYVKGLADNPLCSESFALNDKKQSFAVQIRNGECNMHKQRLQGQLDGVVFSMVIVVSFHSMFVTKVDRAYRAMCFYKTESKVTNSIDVSMIGTTDISVKAGMPTCGYVIRSGSPDGEKIRYAKVGDKIYHCWECDGDDYGFLVHSCHVNDGRTNKFDLIDADGCAIDTIILPDPSYTPTLQKACVQTHGFKFADTSTLYFQCVMELCRKAANECEGVSPPDCSPRRKRFADLVLPITQNPVFPNHTANPDTPEDGFDVLYTLNVLDQVSAEVDAEDIAPPKTFINNMNKELGSSQKGKVIISNQDSNSSSKSSASDCLTSNSFILMIALFIFMLFGVLLLVFYLAIKLRSYTQLRKGTNTSTSARKKPTKSSNSSV